MVTDIDIWRSANVLVKRHGDDALVQAAMQADARLAAGDLNGYAVWKRIVAAIENLRRDRPVAGEGLN